MKDYLTIRKSDGIGVFGYKAGVLESITNESPKTVDLTIAASVGETKRIVLQEKETYRLDIDIWQCIRDRFMPYVEAETDVLLSVAWQSKDPGSPLSDIHIGSYEPEV